MNKTLRLMILFCSLGLIACGEGLEAGRVGAGKGDLIGDRVKGEPCDWDWQCRADTGYVCRPEPEDGSPRCGLKIAGGGACEESDDCESGKCYAEVCKPLSEQQARESIAEPNSKPVPDHPAGTICQGTEFWCWHWMSDPGTTCQCYVEAFDAWIYGRLD